jgi:hypothetical protein
MKKNVKIYVDWKQLFVSETYRNQFIQFKRILKTNII